MVTRREQRAFTLIELLVVIAIIAILAAMLFPVFARARESARKIQCLSNVKNIATAVQMYLTDYDRLPSDASHDPAAMSFFATQPGRGGGGDNPGCWRITWANPFVRWPVVFDEYTKNRDVWRCPSARWSPSVWFVVPNYGSNGTWWGYLQDHEGVWGTGKAVSPCAYAFPPGWGGEVTDSISQMRLAAPQEYGWITGPSNASSLNCFDQGIGLPEELEMGMKTSQIADPSWQIVCADNGGLVTLHNIRNQLWGFCANGCADWQNCPVTQVCGLDGDVYDKFWSDASYRSKFTRHMGGQNYGFADGHASWYPAEQVVSLHEGNKCCQPPDQAFVWHDGPMKGMCQCVGPIQ